MRAARATGRFIWVAVIVIVVLGFVPLLMISGSRLVGGSTNGTAQLASFTPLAGACWMLALLVLVVLRSWWFAGFAGLLVAVHLFWLAPPVFEHLDADPVPDGTALRVLTINTQFGGADVEELASLVKDRSVDLVAVQEMTPEFEQRFTAAIGAQLPSHVGVLSPADLAGGSGIWSRWPLRSEGVVTAPFKMPKVRVEVPGAGAVEVIGVHTLSPLPSRVQRWHDDLDMLAKQSRTDTGPMLLMGDFNATRDHAPFRRVLAGPLFDAYDASALLPWMGQSWPADRRFIPPSIRIDHILASEDDFSVSRIGTFSINGTDHRAVQADLLLQNPTDSPSSDPGFAPAASPTPETTGSAG